MRVCHKYMTHPHFFLLDADSSAGYQPMLASKSCLLYTSDAADE